MCGSLSKTMRMQLRDIDSTCQDGDDDDDGDDGDNDDDGEDDADGDYNQDHCQDHDTAKTINMTMAALLAFITMIMAMDMVTLVSPTQSHHNLKFVPNGPVSRKAYSHQCR